MDKTNNEQPENKRNPWPKQATNPNTQYHACWLYYHADGGNNDFVPKLFFGLKYMETIPSKAQDITETIY